MAKYYMIAFDDLQILSLAGDALGHALYEILIEQDMDIKPFLPLNDDFDRAAAPHVPVVIAGVIVGKFLGKYYDEWAVGLHSKPAIVPPQSIACIISSTDFEEIVGMSGKQLADDLIAYRSDPSTILSQDKIAPVFVNDTNGIFPLHILRATAFLPKDKNKIVYTQAGPSFDKGFEGPKYASLA